MSLQELLGFLLSNWQSVVAWFTQWVANVIQLATNFWQYLQQKKTEAVTESNLNTATVVSGAIVLIKTIIKTGDDLIHGRISQVVVDLLFGIQVVRDTLSAGIELAKSEGNAALQAGLTKVYNAVDTVYSGLKGLIDALGLNIHNRIDQLEFEFRKIITVAGLSVEEKRLLLKMFLDDPLGFIASVFFEIAIPILIYELTKGIAKDEMDVGSPPKFDSKISPRSPTRTSD